MSAVHYDAMIIGSGPSGSFAAKELTAHGLKVVLIEAGPEIGPKDFDAAKTIRQSDINLRQRAKATLTGQGVRSSAPQNRAISSSTGRSNARSRQ